MPRQTVKKPTTAELKRELHQRLNLPMRRLPGLLRARERTARKLAFLDEQIAATYSLLGIKANSENPAPTYRLRDVIESVMGADQLGIPEITRRVRDSGYPTTGNDLRAAINQVLTTDKRFRRVARGVYTLRSKSRTASVAQRASRGDSR